LANWKITNGEGFTIRKIGEEENTFDILAINAYNYRVALTNKKSFVYKNKLKTFNREGLKKF